MFIHRSTDGADGGGGGRRHELRFQWRDSRASQCRLTVDGVFSPLELSLIRPGPDGISCVHFQALSGEEDTEGVLIESVEGGQ